MLFQFSDTYFSITWPHFNLNLFLLCTLETPTLSDSESADGRLKPEEIGLELDETTQVDDEHEQDNADNDDDDDEVSGAIAMPLGSSIRHGVAASYHHAGLSNRNLDRSRMGFSLVTGSQYNTNVGSVTRSTYQPSVRIPAVVPINSPDSRLSTTVPVHRSFF